MVLYVIAVGRSGTIRQTSDSGANWFIRNSGTPNSDLNSVDCAGVSCWIVGESGTILHSGDSGVTWSPQLSGTTNELLSVRFLNEQEGWAVGWAATVLKTVNGGDTWTKLNFGTSSIFADVDFVNSLTGWIGASELRHTIDGGLNWSFQTLTAGGSTIDFVDQNHGWGVSSNNVGRTVNGGATWTPVEPIFSGSLRDVQFLNTQVGFIAGTTGNLFITENGGDDWIRGSFAATYDIRSINMLNRNIGWLVASARTSGSGSVWMTTDGGLNWSQQSVGSVTTLYSVISFDREGDYNGDGVVNAADYTVFRDKLGAVTLLNRSSAISGPVGREDYEFWASQFGSTPGGSNVSVPEPTTFMLWVVGALSVLALSYSRVTSPSR